MKKKGIATLALAGALAVSMVPAFAATTSQNTTVGYTAGGNASTDGRVMVTIPKDVTFTNTNKKVTGFDVKAWVWDAVAGKWDVPNTTVGQGKGQYTTPTLGATKAIKVNVNSANEYKLKNTSNTGVEGEYTYTVGGKVMANDAEGNTTNLVGTLQDAQSAYTLSGTVEMTKTPNVGQTENAVYFSDLLTFSFSGL